MTAKARYIVATQVDVTSEKTSEAARDMANHRLRSALAATSEGFLLLNPNGKIVVANDRYRDFFETETTVWNEGERFSETWTRRLIDLG